MSVGAIALVAGCGGGGAAPTAPVPPDTLSVTIEGAGEPAFRIELACAIADRDACAGVLEVLRAADAESCDRRRDERSRITVRGVIDGERVAATLRRRTSCEVSAYDRALTAVGL